MSKKRRKEFYKSKRKDWGLTKPFTKVQESTKAYKRDTKQILKTWQRCHG